MCKSVYCIYVLVNNHIFIFDEATYYYLYVDVAVGCTTVLFTQCEVPFVFALKYRFAYRCKSNE